MEPNGLPYRYTIEIYKRDSSEHLGALPVVPDFAPALAWAALQAVRKDPNRPVVLDTDGCRIGPLWDTKLGNPYLSGLRAVVAHRGTPEVALDIPLSFFHGLAKTASSDLVKSGKLESGEVFQYRVCAYPVPTKSVDAKQPHEAVSAFSVNPVVEELEVDRRPMEHFLADSCLHGPDEEEQMPVFLPRRVLDEAEALMRVAEAEETGGVLIGHVHRDRGWGELFLEVTAQIPARHAQQELTRLTFTPETWAAVDAAISLRGQGEIYLGWWHTHPSGHWCDECPAETRKQCKRSGQLSGDFFSVHDVALHRTVFPRAYSIGLVISDRCETGTDIDPVWGLYGWRHGMVSSRGFHVLGAADSAAVSAVPVQQEGEENDPSH